jgi:hypothetical protein
MKFRFLALLFVACSMDAIPTGLQQTPSGPGTTVIFDALALPLPNIPLPNDFATFADPTSRTGRRVNASLIAPTSMETIARTSFDELEGWGTFAPITVAFQRSADADPALPAINLDNVRSRMLGDGYVFADDPVYLINLTTGIPMVLDMGNGSFNVALRDPQNYWPNDPHVATSNLLYEANEEGAGLLQGDYTPSRDIDFDGVLDHPDTWGPLGPGQIQGVDNLLDWYELETDTLILRPVLPLDEMTEYAVVITDRLTGNDGNPVKSPFPNVYHPSQVDAMSTLQAVLGQSTLSNYYGDIAGSGLQHVAFAWAFTTQPTIADMIALRNGLYGVGPFAYFATQFPAKSTALRAVGTISGNTQPAGWDSMPACAPRAAHPYIVDPNLPDVLASLGQLYSSVFGYDVGNIAALNEENSHIDHVVIGTYTSPFLEGDPQGQDPDARFQVNYQTGQGAVTSDTVSFMLIVPKETATYKQPFPVSLFGHGVGGNFTEAMEYGGDYARNGIAMIAINMPQHGLPTDASIRVPALATLTPDCLTPWVDALLTTRAVDRNGDGILDPGWWWWTSHIANVRDNVRQGTLDEMQLTRIMRTFDGTTLSGQDFNGDGNEDLAGDFDSDGVPDVGGPNVSFYAAGESLGGIMSEIQGGIDHQLAGTVPMSGGGGLTDVGSRSYGVASSFGQLFGPLLISVPATARPPQQNNGMTVLQTNCSSSQMTLRFVVEDGPNMDEVEIACLNPDEDGPGKTVVITNLTSQSDKVHCARTLADGSLRIEFGATYLDDLDIQFYNAPDVVDSYATCNPTAAAPVGRHVTTFEQKATQYFPASTATCPSDPSPGCANFIDRFFPVGSLLVAPQDGLGFKRNSPKSRRFWFLAQMGVDPADPINYAPYYMMRPLPDPSGNPVKPRALLGADTVGDAFVNIETGLNFARAAGAIPFFPPSALALYPEYADYVTPQPLYDAYGGLTPNQVLISNYEVEGVARFGRRPAGPNCGVNYNTSNPTICPSNPQPNATTCQNTLYDADWVSEGGNHYDAQHPALPLRLARVTGLHVDPTNPQTLLDAWAPRLQGVPFSADANAWDASQPILGVVNVYIQPQGAHTWDVVDACKLWDDAQYGGNMSGHFLQSGGTDPYYLSHPTTHECLETLTCPFFAP